MIWEYHHNTGHSHLPLCYAPLFVLPTPEFTPELEWLRQVPVPAFQELKDMGSRFNINLFK